MMKTWTKILPFIFIEWYSKKNLSKRYLLDSKVRVVQPFKGTFIGVK